MREKTVNIITELKKGLIDGKKSNNTYYQLAFENEYPRSIMSQLEFLQYLEERGVEFIFQSSLHDFDIEGTAPAELYQDTPDTFKNKTSIIVKIEQAMNTLVQYEGCWEDFKDE